MQALLLWVQASLPGCQGVLQDYLEGPPWQDPQQKREQVQFSLTIVR